MEAPRGPDAPLGDVLDDWLVESLKRYRDLHVYHLDHPTRIIEWTSEKTICVAGFGCSRNELLELHLPPKLFAEENKGLCAERDFKVIHGGFTDSPVHCARHIPGTRCVVTNDGRSSRLELWDVGGEESDVIRRTGSVDPGTAAERGSRMAAGPSSRPSVLHGDRLSHIQLSHLPSGKSVYNLETDNPDPLSGLQFVSDSVFLTCCSNGNLYVLDTRVRSLAQPTPVSPLQPLPPAGGGDGIHWCMDSTMGQSCLDPACCRVVRLSSRGEGEVSDLRDLRIPVCRVQLDVRTNGDGLCQDFLRVSWAPALKDCIAVSGFSGTVQIFNISTREAELKDAVELFEHQGHVVLSENSESRAPLLTTSHVWHPNRPRTLLSAATDGSVHLWDWVPPTTTDD